MNRRRRTDKNIAVLASGATGSSIGGFLTKAGYNPLLIDQWPAHVEAMKANGLLVIMVNENEQFRVKVNAVHLCDVCTLNQQFDIVFLTSKSYDSCWLAEFIKPYLKPDGVVIPVQNSLNPEWVAPIIGYERTMGCVIKQATELWVPGEVKRHTPVSKLTFMVGELHGRMTPRAKQVTELLSPVGVTVATTNIWGGLWTKVISATGMAVTALAGGKRAQEATENPLLFKIVLKQSKEVLRVGEALGYTLEDLHGVGEDSFKGSEDEILERVHQAVSANLGSAQSNVVTQDFQKGRRTEVDFINGLVAKRGRKAGVPTPINEAVTALVKEIEQGKRKPDPANLEVLAKYV